MKRKVLPAQEKLESLLEYNKTTGELFWLRPQGSRGVPRQRAGGIEYSAKSNPYRTIRVEKILYMEHRIIWMLVTGEDLGILEVDHINGVKSDNRWCNLRRATHANNNQNTKIQKNNSSGAKGVAWHSQKQKWRAYVSEGPRGASKQRHLGLFSTVEEAAAAAKAARESLHKHFAKHG